MENQNAEAKKTYTPLERMQLAQKLDKELGEFIDSLPKKKYEDGWPEERWEEEMEKHPFFMSKPPEPGAELHPLYEGLQQLKYDPEENEPEELAKTYKDDGNFNFRHKNYRLAILSYTEGLKINCGNSEVDAKLYNNRSASHYFLKNFRSSLQDCESALKIKPKHEKVLLRAANCCFEMGKYELSVMYCDRYLDVDKANRNVFELRKKCLKQSKLKERNERKKNLEERKKVTEEEAFIEEISKRGITLAEGEHGLSIKSLESSFPYFAGRTVHFDENKNLVWPVVLMYPEYKTMDYIQEFNETQTFEEQLSEVFATNPDWDLEKKYSLDTVNIYYETSKKKLSTVNLCDTLKKILKRDNYTVTGGTPSFLLLVRNSAAENRFLENY